MVVEVVVPCSSLARVAGVALVGGVATVVLAAGLATTARVLVVLAGAPFPT